MLKKRKVTEVVRGTVQERVFVDSPETSIATPTEAEDQLRAGKVLKDFDGAEWRFNGTFEVRSPDLNVHTWRPFGRAPMIDDCPFEEA